MNPARPILPVLRPTDHCDQRRNPSLPIPNGWYGLLASRDLRRGQVMRLRFFARELVAYRGMDGQARVLNAYCPHLGAHLGRGGRVNGASIECPFHGWRFSGDGVCSYVPDGEPPRVGVRSWPVDEHSGTVFVYHDIEERTPHYRVSRIPELDRNGWHSATEVRTRWIGHLQDQRENIVDVSHFTTIHGQPIVPEQTFRTEGPFAYVEQSFMLAGRGIPYHVELCGPGVVTVRMGWPVNSCVVAFSNPIDDDAFEFRWLATTKKLRFAPLVSRIFQHFMVRRSWHDIHIEKEIMDHKTHLERPVLLPHEHYIREYREWFRQFCDGDSRPALREPLASSSAP